MPKGNVVVILMRWASILALFCGACVTSKEYKPPPSAPPQLRLPRNDVYEGSVLTGKLSPRFVWEAPATDSAAFTYELQYSPDSKFESDVTSVETAELSHQPDAPLPVSTVPPVGRRYYWRVRACQSDVCSDFSKPWWVNLGRSAKDFNGDGYADVAVGNPSYQNRGAVYIYFGGPGPTLDTTADGFIDDGTTDARFGNRLSSAQDFNGDGFSDLIVASLKEQHLYLGKAGVSFDDTVDITFSHPGEQHVYSRIAAAGDINADGYSDIFVGDPGGSPFGQYSGRAYIYLGGVAGLLDQPDWTLSGRVALQAFGNSAAAGDMNGDGYSDVAISSHDFSDDYIQMCLSEVVLGSNSPSAEEAHSIRFISPIDYCSSRALLVKDLNGDGFSDLVRGVNDPPSAAMIHTAMGRREPTDTITDTITGEGQPFTYLSGLYSLGDLNGDGLSDIATYEGNRGTTYILFGDRNAKGGIAQPASGILTLSYNAMAAAGDVNGDGFDDVIAGNSNTSTASILFGAPGGAFDARPDWTLTDAPGFGDSVAD